MTEITRHYAFCKDRQIHYRMAGSGPPVVMFHQSPRSSAEFEPIIRDWARRFTVIAPDTPGNGQSDSLVAPLTDEQPDMFVFAHAMADFMDAIGLKKTCVFGYHTGSAIALAMAKLYPARIACVAVNGFAVLTEQEQDAFLSGYLPHYVPDWSGQHLAWLWARYREQVIFFPWFAARNETRMPYDMSDMDKMHDQIMDHLWAGDAYRHAYHAAFAFDKNAVMGELKMPVTIMAAPPDPLVAHLDRLPELPENITIERPENASALLARAYAIFSETDLPDFQPNPAPAEAGKLLRDYVGVGTEKPLHVRAASVPEKAKDKNKNVVLLLHDILQSSACLEADANALNAGGYEILAPDLPAHGLSADQKDANPAAFAQTMASILAPYLAAHDKQISHIVTYGLSDVIGQALQTRLATKLAESGSAAAPPKLIHVAGLHLADAHQHIAKDWLPDLTPSAYGGHLLAGWHFARGQSLFWPAHYEKKTAIIPIDENLAPDAVETRFTALMEARAAAYECARHLLADGGGESAGKAGTQAQILLPEWAKNMPHAAPPAPEAQTHYYEGGSLAARHKALLAALQR